MTLHGHFLQLGGTRQFKMNGLTPALHFTNSTIISHIGCNEHNLGTLFFSGNSQRVESSGVGHGSLVRDRIIYRCSNQALAAFRIAYVTANGIISCTLRHRCSNVEDTGE